jgi:hypothetical protein
MTTIFLANRAASVSENPVLSQETIDLSVKAKAQLMGIVMFAGLFGEIGCEQHLLD